MAGAKWPKALKDAVFAVLVRRGFGGPQLNLRTFSQRSDIISCRCCRTVSWGLQTGRARRSTVEAQRLLKRLLSDRIVFRESLRGGWVIGTFERWALTVPQECRLGPRKTLQKSWEFKIPEHPFSGDSCRLCTVSPQSPGSRFPERRSET